MEGDPLSFGTHSTTTTKHPTSLILILTLTSLVATQIIACVFDRKMYSLRLQQIQLTRILADRSDAAAGLRRFAARTPFASLAEAAVTRGPAAVVLFFPDRIVQMSPVGRGALTSTSPAKARQSAWQSRRIRDMPP